MSFIAQLRLDEKLGSPTKIFAEAVGDVADGAGVGVMVGDWRVQFVEYVVAFWVAGIVLIVAVFSLPWGKGKRKRDE